MNWVELTGPAVLGLGLALHLVVDGDHGDRVLGVRIQALQDHGGGGPRDLVLNTHTREHKASGSDRQADRQADRHRDRQADTQTDRRTDRQGLNTT